MYYGRLTWVSHLSPSDIDFILSENINKSWWQKQYPVVDILKAQNNFNGYVKNNKFKLYHLRYTTDRRTFYPVVVGEFYKENNQTVIKLCVRASIISSLFFVFMMFLCLIFILAFIFIKEMNYILYAFLMSVVLMSFYFSFINNSREILVELMYLLRTNSA